MVHSATRPIAPSTLSERIRELIDQQPAGHSLLRPFYSDPEIYRFDVDRIWRRGWLFAGHSCEIPKVGDFFTVKLDTDSIVIARAENGEAHAMHNVCRHRGSLICEEERGQVRHLACPYHRWTYGLDGGLVHAPGMQEDLPKSELGLHPVALREVAGLIYISLAEEPLDFERAQEVLSAVARPQGLGRARVAKAVDYLVKANWKLVWENNRECFHCNTNHPQYIKANFDHYNADDTTPKIREQIAAAVSRSEAKWAASGLSVSHKQTGMTTFPDVERNIWFSTNRTPLVDGYVSETMDGSQVAPLMGDYRDPDVGTVRMRSLPNFWNHSSCDHGVSTRLLPLGPELTAIRVWWLVEQNAVEGRDYDLAKLMPFWQLTSEQDWEICERQQRGVNSSAYTPGPYSTYKEYNVDAFIRWYLKQLQS
ncbi:MAG TPA: aromatic ring-hydroxylating dioxygenase subunit alpha [Verrucomicrobiae bacterium]|nr:aromatic ring-hydroxylating dioxygenase subunit alpha [Verrucomicrobiae bacterium]